MKKILNNPPNDLTKPKLRSKYFSGFVLKCLIITPNNLLSFQYPVSLHQQTDTDAGGSNLFADGLSLPGMSRAAVWNEFKRECT